MIANTIKINGMTCGKCVKKIEQSISSSNLGFEDVKVTKGPDVLSFNSQSLINPNLLNTFFKENNLTKYSASKVGEVKEIKLFALTKRLYPLILIVSYIFLVVAAVAFVTNDFSMSTLMSHYMGGFFITFSFFKFLNLKGFVDAFQTYDPVAKKIKNYGYFYAFYELIAGITYLIAPQAFLLNISVVILLSITSLGVWQAVRSKSTIQCACLGTVFNLPMTYVTIFENVVMIVMALVMILQNH